MKSQTKMKKLFDRRTDKQGFPGDQVLMLLPVVGSPFQAKFAGPYAIFRKVSDQNYVISTPDRRRKTQLCHVNLLKSYHLASSVGPFTGEGKPMAVAAPMGDLCQTPLLVEGKKDDVNSPDDCVLQGRLNPSEN